jgi:hypothetical protein
MSTVKIEDIVKDPSKLKANPLKRKYTIFNFVSEFFRRRKLEKHLEEVRKQLYEPKNHIDNSHIKFGF